MSSRRLERSKGRREIGRFAGIPVAVMDHPAYTTLGHPAAHLLQEFARQYTGHNNGDLCAAIQVLKPRGWRSRATIDAAIRELLEHKLIRKSRQGGRNAPNLYALTWAAIDECGGKLDIEATAIPPGDWRTFCPVNSISHARETGNPCTGDGQPDHEKGGFNTAPCPADGLVVANSPPDLAREMGTLIIYQGVQGDETSTIQRERLERTGKKP